MPLDAPSTVPTPSPPPPTPFDGGGGIRRNLLAAQAKQKVQKVRNFIRAMQPGADVHNSGRGLVEGNDPCSRTMEDGRPDYNDTTWSDRIEGYFLNRQGAGCGEADYTGPDDGPYAPIGKHFHFR